MSISDLTLIHVSSYCWDLRLRNTEWSACCAALEGAQGHAGALKSTQSSLGSQLSEPEIDFVSQHPPVTRGGRSCTNPATATVCLVEPELASTLLILTDTCAPVAGDRAIIKIIMGGKNGENSHKWGFLRAAVWSGRNGVALALLCVVTLIGPPTRQQTSVLLPERKTEKSQTPWEKNAAGPEHLEIPSGGRERQGWDEKKTCQS